MVKEPTAKFKLYYKYDNGQMSDPENFNIPELIGVHKIKIRTYFREMLKHFNTTLNKNESGRHFVKVTQKIKVTTKAKLKNERYYNV